jgi:hypothetical protein
MSGRLRILMELHPEKGNPVAVRDSALLLPGEDLASGAAELAERVVERLVEEAGATSRAPDQRAVQSLKPFAL